MTYEEKSEYTTSYYRCVDPIENFKIRVVLKPLKNLSIPLPSFDANSSPTLSPIDKVATNEEEYTFKWQEKIFSKKEIKKCSADPDWKKKISEKYNDNHTFALMNLKNYPKKLFSYTDVDNYSACDSNLFLDKSEPISHLRKRFNKLHVTGQNTKNFKNIPKKKVINFYPSDEFKKQNHMLNKNLQKMFVMIDLGTRLKSGSKKDEEENIEYVLCALSYNHFNNVLEVTPSFSDSKLKPYVVGIDNEDTKNCYYFWLYHASPTIPVENLTKEIKIINKVFDHQEDLRKLYLDSDFFVGEPHHMYVTLFGEIISAQDFDYDHLYIHYFLKLPNDLKYSDVDSLRGTTQTSNRNSQGICFFSNLFEMNFSFDLNSDEEFLNGNPELFFEVLSIDKYNRYRNEGYSYITIPRKPGNYNFTLKCWRALDNHIQSRLQRFFIGGGPELEDVSYVGSKTCGKEEVMSRLGFQTIPSGQIDVRLNIVHQSEFLKTSRGKLKKNESTLERVNADSLLGSVNAVLEAFRKARERMLEAKKGLENHSNDTFAKLKREFESTNSN